MLLCISPFDHRRDTLISLFPTFHSNDSIAMNTPNSPPRTLWDVIEGADIWSARDHCPGLQDVIPQVIEALQRFEDPERLARWRAGRDRRFNERSPPYSGETPVFPSFEGSPVVDESVRYDEWLLDHQQSMPGKQFRSQSKREKARIIYQSEKEREGRRQTLPFDPSLEYQANAENNVRSRWIEHGIWKEEWGAAWPKWAESFCGWLIPPGGRGPRPSGFWEHEEEPESEPKPEPQPKPATEQLTVTYERDTSASRPYHQFLYQVSKEREWITDEVQYLGSTETVDIQAEAHENIKKIWIEDKIWNPEWGGLPGMKWMHEERPPSPDSIKEQHQLLGQSPDVVGNGERQHGSPSPRGFDSEPRPSVDDDRAGSKLLTRALNEPRGTNPSSAEDQPPITSSGPRRSARIAERLRKAAAASEQSPESKMPACNESGQRNFSPAEAQPSVATRTRPSNARRAGRMRKAAVGRKRWA